MSALYIFNTTTQITYFSRAWNRYIYLIILPRSSALVNDEKSTARESDYLNNFLSSYGIKLGACVPSHDCLRTTLRPSSLMLEIWAKSRIWYYAQYIAYLPKNDRGASGRTATSPDSCSGSDSFPFSEADPKRVSWMKATRGRPHRGDETGVWRPYRIPPDNRVRVQVIFEDAPVGRLWLPPQLSSWCWVTSNRKEIGIGCILDLSACLHGYYICEYI